MNGEENETENIRNSGGNALFAFRMRRGRQHLMLKANMRYGAAPNTLKVLRDAHIYEEIKGIASVSMMVARGEYESAQLILEAETRIDDFDVRASGLTDGKEM